MLPMDYKLTFKCYFLLIVALLFSKKTNGQGISFNSNDKLISERTSFNVFALKQATFGDVFSLEFDLSIEKLETFGYIFTINDLNYQDNMVFYNCIYLLP